MLSRHYQRSGDADSSYNGTTLRSNDSDTLDLSSDYESEDLLSETSADRAFVVSDTDALSYNSDRSSMEGEVSRGLEEGTLDEIEDPSPLGKKKAIKAISKRTVFCNGQPETHLLVLWYSWEKSRNPSETE
ncbi:uncharacterized protein N7498_001699 [Penicillium cinerascens]|uniref:Uncharacterized protein n=1 Tax=Penicillium cinerascens TaxID=70096 RepID=A0A9W9N8P8_9EURO|nr:uncharacterized protein N7498_001699 [Penicillium cinerascens]KAJ5215292.1 hypothetical protein N7498_001699 [Penicillium cinerascens]